MFPIKVKKSLNEVDDQAKNKRVLIRNVIIIAIILAIFIIPYVVNFEFYVEEDTPAGNLDQFLDVTKETGQTTAGADVEKLATAPTDSTPVGELKQDSPAGVSTDGSSAGATTIADGGAVTAGSETSSSPVVDGGVAPGEAASAEQSASEQSASEAGEGRLNKKAQISDAKKKEMTTTEILGTKIYQKLGQQSPGKSCVVFYAEDPEVVKDVVSTKICPDERDRHIEFHMKGIFSSHPHAPNEVDSEPVRVRYVHAGALVWTTFFQQHNDQHNTIVVPPGITTDVKYLTTDQEEMFHKEFDSVRVLHTMAPVGKTRGLQANFPTCAQFYESVNVGTKSKGFMVCQGNSKVKRADYSLEKLSEFNVNPQTTDTNGITYIVAGAKVSLWAFFGKNLDGDMLQVPKGTTADLNQVKRVKQEKDGSSKELTWNKKIKSFKLKFE